MRTLSGNDEFASLKKTVIDAYSRLFPVVKPGDAGKKTDSLHLNKIWIDDSGLESMDFGSQKKARLSGSTWGAPVYADLELRSPEGKVIDHAAKIRLATIPKLTPRGSYIVQGTEYQVANQLRKKPGVYIHRRQTGDEFKVDVTLKAGDKIQRFNVHYDPTTTKYVVAFNHTKVPLYPLLSVLGVSDDQIRSAWGSEIFALNKVDVSKHLPKLADKLARVTTDNTQTAREAIVTVAKTLLADPEVCKFTLGEAHNNLNGKMLLEASTKLKKVYLGEQEPDDPESLLFKEVLSVEDMLHDALNSDRQKKILADFLSRGLGRKQKIKEIINFKKLSGPIETFFSRDDRSGTPEQTNPINMISEKHKVTFMGTGAVTNKHAVTNDMREVHPSHVGFLDPVHTPEGEKVGVTLHLTAGAVKDGRGVKTRVINTKTGKLELLSPQELYSKAVAFPDEGELKNGRVSFHDNNVRAQYQGKLKQLTPKEIDYILPTHTTLFSYSTNLIPFLHSDQGNRAAMASKMLGQAIPLVEREAPYVQTELSAGKTFHQAIGEEFSLKAPVSGKVTQVTADHITIGKTKVSLYNDFPLNQKTYISHEPKVKVGDTVKEGQLIADSNYTKDGTLALGKNLSVAYLPYPGLTFDDGIVITESAAKKLASQHLFKYSFPVEKGKSETSLNRFNAYYPNIIPRARREDFDSDGVIKKGAVVRPGDVVIAGMRYELQSQENMFAKRINHRALMRPWSNSSVTYQGEFEGTVSDVQKSAENIDVYVKSIEVAKESDKLAGVHGNKGVITKVIPDHEAPRTKDGKIPDVFLNPHGVVGRVNPGQIFESAAGKIARSTGKTYLVKNFDNQRSNEKILKDLVTSKVDDVEEMFLPNGTPMGRVHVGNPYILRLAKTGKTGFSARSPGKGYDLNLQPTKSGETGTKAVDLLTFYSMLSHGAKKNIADAHRKSEKNDEYWHAIETGKPLPALKPTFAYEKFVNLIKGAGINVEKDGQSLYIHPLTDKETSRLSNGKVTDHNFFYAKNGVPKKEGYFGVLTGGRNGNKYTHLDLPEPLPNPVCEKPIRYLLDLTGPRYDNIVAGKEWVTIDGVKKTGGEAIKAQLAKIKPLEEIARQEKLLESTNVPAKIERINQKLRYLHALKETGLSPAEAYTRSKILVIPPAHRPILEVPGAGYSVAPVNLLYQLTGVLSDSFNYPAMKLLPDEEKSELRTDLYKTTRALTGLEPVTTRGKDAPIEGFISQITGSQPKEGFFLNKVISKRQDLVGRGVITAAPDLHIDQLGIPEKMAWKIFEPFLVREFTIRGISADVARKEIQAKTARAKSFLEVAMKNRTVLMNRAPSLHKFSIMSFKPVLTTGLAVRVPPLVLKGFGGDFDGDAVTIHVPTNNEAVQESLKMLPSRNLVKPGTGELMIMPSQESTIGLYFLSHTAEGRKSINAILPPKFHVTEVLDKNTAKKLYERISKEDPTHYADYVLKLKALGDKTAYESGFSVGVRDTIVNTKTRDKLFLNADKEAAKIKAMKLPEHEKSLKIARLYQEAAATAFDETKKELKGKNNSFYHMVTSGARGKAEQLQQLILAPGVVEDSKGRLVPVPLKNSYAEGLRSADYFAASYGARKGILDKSLQTSAPGALNKEIIANTIDTLITQADCGTARGIEVSLDSSDVYNRHLVKDQAGAAKNTLMTPQLISVMKKKGLKTVFVRSPLRCLASKGVCARCYGLDEHGHLPAIGENVGVKAGQAISEPMTQMILRTFHTGGVAGAAPVTSGFNRVQQILHMPDSHVTGEAVQSTVYGKVTKIAPGPGGSTIVSVGTTAHTIPPNKELTVKLNQTVSPGDLLCGGNLKPQNLLKYKGMESAQDYLVDELQKTYKASDSHVEKRMFETVVRSITNMTRVVKAPAESGFRPGEIAPFSSVQQYNLQRKDTVKTEDAEGYILANTTGNILQGHVLTKRDLDYLKGIGHNQIDVLKKAVVHKPILKNIQHLTKERKDWMSQLGFRYISDALTDGAAERWKSELSGNHPVPAYAYGATFGRTKENY